jgi:hypothetical protein
VSVVQLVEQLADRVRRPALPDLPGLLGLLVQLHECRDACVEDMDPRLQSPEMQRVVAREGYISGSAGFVWIDGLVMAHLRA